MSKHTPGPWIIRKGDEWTTDIVTDDGVNENGCRMYWNIASCNKQRDEVDANLLLIAAAPDLLAALDDCVEALAHLQDRLGVKVNPPTLDRARAAIAKAKGK